MLTTLFLGGGNITSAMIAGLRLARYEQPIVVYDRNPEKTRALRREFHIEIARDLQSAVEQAGTLIVAVRPGSVAGLLDEVARCGAKKLPAIAVSLAAGIPLAKLRKRLGPRVRWVRAMPSPVCRIGRGLTALTFGRNISGSDRKRINQLFKLLGPVLEIPERQFDAFTATYSSTHGYHALATLAAATQAAGLDRKTALAAAAHALADGIHYWRETGLALDVLLREAATPGGIAAATLGAMDDAGYKRVVARGVAAGVKRARRNTKV